MKTSHWEYDDFGAYEEELEEEFFPSNSGEERGMISFLSMGEAS